VEGAVTRKGICRIRRAWGRGLEPTFDVKSEHAKIGELTLENDILEDALGRGNQPGARL
jgi:hypothetical protein